MWKSNFPPNWKQYCSLAYCATANRTWKNKILLFSAHTPSLLLYNKSHIILNCMGQMKRKSVSAVINLSKSVRAYAICIFIMWDIGIDAEVRLSCLFKPSLVNLVGFVLCSSVVYSYLSHILLYFFHPIVNFTLILLFGCSLMSTRHFTSVPLNSWKSARVCEKNALCLLNQNSSGFLVWMCWWVISAFMIPLCVCLVLLHWLYTCSYFVS